MPRRSVVPSSPGRKTTKADVDQFGTQTRLFCAYRMCAAPLTMPATGRPRRFCGDPCRKQDHAERRQRERIEAERIEAEEARHARLAEVTALGLGLVAAIDASPGRAGQLLVDLLLDCDRGYNGSLVLREYQLSSLLAELGRPPTKRSR